MTDRARTVLFVFRSAWMWLRWPLAVGLMWWLYRQNRTEFEQLSGRSVDWGWLALAFVLCFGSIVSTYIRWWMLVRAQDFDFPLRDALRIGFLGYLFNYVAPGAVGGDFVKAVLLARGQASRRWLAAATVAVDRVVGLVALLLTGALTIALPTTLALKAEMRVYLHCYLWLGTGGLAGMLLVMTPRFTRGPWLRSLTGWPIVGGVAAGAIQSIALYQARPAVMIRVLALSIAGHVAMLSSFWCCAQAIHPEGSIPSLAEHLQFVPAAEVLGVLVPLPGGVGALEGALGHFYRLAGSSFGDGLLTGMTYRVISLVIAGVGALCYAAMRKDMTTVFDVACEMTEAEGNAVDAKRMPSPDEERGGASQASSLPQFHS